MIILSLHIHVVPNPYDFVSYVEHQRRSLAEWPSCSISYNDSEWRPVAVKLQNSEIEFTEVTNLLKAYDNNLSKYGHSAKFVPQRKESHDVE